MRAKDAIETAAALAAYRQEAERKAAKELNAKLLLQVTTLEARLEEFQSLRRLSVPLPAIKTARKGRVLSTDRREAAAFAAASDWHVGERVDPRLIQGMNEYTPEIAALRSRRFFEGVAWLIREQRQTFDIQTLVLWLGGDFLSGYIHEELVESNFMSPLEEAAYARTLLKAGIKSLRKDLPDLKLQIPCNFGNHDRTTDKTRIGTAGANSYTKAMYADLAEIFEGDAGVAFQIAEGHHLVTPIYDFRMHLHHGDCVKGGGGIGGIDVPLNRAAIRWRAKYNAHCSTIGHFHQYQGGQQVIRNGSMIGYNSYADWLAGAMPEPAQQAFAIIDRKRGLCKQTPIWVAE